MKINKSKSTFYKQKGKSLLPSLSQTFSKSPSSFVEGVFPVYVEKANGCYLYDVDNNKYIDYLMALGPIVLGYNYTPVNKAINKQLEKGIIFSFLRNCSSLSTYLVFVRIYNISQLIINNYK